MNKRDFLSTLASACEQLNVYRDSITIVGGGASLLNGLRTETHDIDILVDDDTYWNLYYSGSDKVLDTYPPVGNMPSCKVVTVRGIDFAMCEGIKTYQTFNHRTFKVLTKLGLLMYRIDLGREKDLVDIKALETEWSKLDDDYMSRLEGMINNVC